MPKNTTRITIGEAISKRSAAIAKARATNPSFITRAGASIHRAITKFETTRGNPNVGVMPKDRFSPKRKR